MPSQNVNLIRTLLWYNYRRIRSLYLRKLCEIRIGSNNYDKVQGLLIIDIPVARITCSIDDHATRYSKYPLPFSVGVRICLP